MDHAYRSPAYSSLERRAIDLALRCKERHDALELAADCQRLLGDAGFERAWMTTDTRRTDSTQRPWQYICTQELYYCKQDALVLICYTSHSPFSPHPGKTACSYLQSASEKVSRFVEFKTQRTDSLFDIAGILLYAQWHFATSSRKSTGEASMILRMHSCTRSGIRTV